MTRRLLLLAEATPDDGPPATSDEDAANAPDVSPIPASGATLTVHPYLVEAGDLLVDHPHARVASLLSDGVYWWFYDIDGQLICLPYSGGVDVDVIRADPGEIDATVGRHPAGREGL